MLYVIATPIGNLEDITFRAVRILQNVDVVFAEDTRHTLKLLNHLDIKKPLYSCHEHNETSRASLLLEMLRKQKDIALVSDAGMPCISDPGSLVLQRVIQEDLPFTVIPGPNAALTALVLSGLSTEQFTFQGFLPREKKALVQCLDTLRLRLETTIIYESPVRLPQTLRMLAQSLGGLRRAAVCRELTKLHETCVRGTLFELCETFDQPPRGECVLLIEGCKHSQAEIKETIPELLSQMQTLIDKGIRLKEAARMTSTNEFSANELYNQFIKNNS